MPSESQVVIDFLLCVLQMESPNSWQLEQPQWRGKQKSTDPMVGIPWRHSPDIYAWVFVASAMWLAYGGNLESTLSAKNDRSKSTGRFISANHSTEVSGRGLPQKTSKISSKNILSTSEMYYLSDHPSRHSKQAHFDGTNEGAAEWKRLVLVWKHAI